MRKISTKVITTVVVAVILSLILGGASIYIMNMISDDRIGQLEDQMYENYDYLIQTQFMTIITQLQGISDAIDAGKIDEKEGKEFAANIIRKAEYDDGMYFWADDLNGNNVAFLGNEDVEGTNRLDLQVELPTT